MRGAVLIAVLVGGCAQAQQGLDVVTGSISSVVAPAAEPATHARQSGRQPGR